MEAGKNPKQTTADQTGRALSPLEGGNAGTGKVCYCLTNQGQFNNPRKNRKLDPEEAERQSGTTRERV